MDKTCRITLPASAASEATLLPAPRVWRSVKGCSACPGDQALFWESRVSWAGEEERHLESERRRKGSGVTMASRDEFLASPEISPNLRHFIAHLVQPPHCPDWETGVRWWIRASNRLL